MKQFRLFGVVIVMTALVPLVSVANAQTGHQTGLFSACKGGAG